MHVAIEISSAQTVLFWKRFAACLQVPSRLPEKVLRGERTFITTTHLSCITEPDPLRTPILFYVVTAARFVAATI